MSDNDEIRMSLEEYGDYLMITDALLCVQKCLEKDGVFDGLKYNYIFERALNTKAFKKNKEFDGRFRKIIGGYEDARG